MSNYKWFRAKLNAAYTMQHNIGKLKRALVQSEYMYKLWCIEADLPMKFREMNEIELENELFKTREIHEERREQRG